LRNAASLDGAIRVATDPAAVTTVGQLRAALQARCGELQLSADSLEFSQSGRKLAADAGTPLDAHAPVLVFVPRPRDKAAQLTTGLLVNDFVEADECERGLQQAHSVFMSNSDPDPSTYTVNLPAVPADVLQSMTEFGFDERRSRKALLLARFNLEDAIEWLALHQDDADIDEPLSFAQLKAIGAVAPRTSITVCRSLRCAIDAGVCTFAVTGKQFMPQEWFVCDTCNFGDREGVCVSCARRCHRGHRISAAKPSPRFYCDCQATGDACQANGVFK